MSKVVNIGVIVRNQEGDTFPVALTPQMVSVIQNLLMQIPVLDSKLVDPNGEKVASKTSIPIIPREIEFDWDKAYSPMDRELEAELMKKLADRYAGMKESEHTDGVITTDVEGLDGKITKLHPEREEGAFKDEQNPFNLELKASGKANVGMTEAEVAEANKAYDEKLVENAEYPVSIEQQEGENTTEETPVNMNPQQDVTVKPDALPLTGDAPIPGGE